MLTFVWRGSRQRDADRRVVAIRKYVAVKRKLPVHVVQPVVAVVFHFYKRERVAALYNFSMALFTSVLQITNYSAFQPFSANFLSTGKFICMSLLKNAQLKKPDTSCKSFQKLIDIFSDVEQIT